MVSQMMGSFLSTHRDCAGNFLEVHIWFGRVSLEFAVLS